MQRQNDIHVAVSKIRTEVIKPSSGQIWEAFPGFRGKEKGKNDETMTHVEDNK